MTISIFCPIFIRPIFVYTPNLSVRMCSMSAADNCVHNPMAIKSINLLLFQIKIVGLLRQIINIKCVVFIVFIVETNEIQCFISANYSSMLTVLIKCATITLYYIKIKLCI